MGQESPTGAGLDPSQPSLQMLLAQALKTYDLPGIGNFIRGGHNTTIPGGPASGSVPIAPPATVPPNPTARPPGGMLPPPPLPPGTVPPGNPTARPPNPAPPFTPPNPKPGMQPGQYDWGRTGDGSQTGIMTPDVQAWMNHMLHGPGLNTAWRQNLQMDPNDIIGSIERASGQKYKPGGWQAPIPGVGY